jgi:PII-like signaling protein
MAMTDGELSGEGLLLRIFIGEDDRWEGKALYEALLLKARAVGLAGCTVIRAAAGFGAASRIHSAKIERLSMDLPIIVEIVDTAERIGRSSPKWRPWWATASPRSSPSRFTSTATSVVSGEYNPAYSLAEQS